MLDADKNRKEEEAKAKKISKVKRAGVLEQWFKSADRFMLPCLCVKL